MVGNPDLTQYRAELDEINADVLPEDHPAHARLTAFNEAEGMEERLVNIAVHAAETLWFKEDVSAQKAGEKAVEAVRNRYC